MFDLIKGLWTQTPNYAPDSAPPVPFSEADDDPTEPCSAPTMRSMLSADAAFELAQTAADAGDYVASKAWMHYANHQSKVGR